MHIPPFLKPGDKVAVVSPAGPVRAVFCSRGGYGCLRTHGLLDWSRFLERPNLTLLMGGRIRLEVTAAGVKVAAG